MITDIRFEGLRTLSEETLLYYLGLEPGRPLDEARLNGAIRELWDRRLIDDIEIERRATRRAASV